MKTYKDNKYLIGVSDIASLTLRSPLGASTLNFMEDGTYYAWIVDDSSVTIPDHYKKVYECNHWLKIYDDTSLQIEFTAKHIEIYRAGDFGCLIRVIFDRKKV